MKRTILVGSLVAAAGFGCVPEEKYRAAKMEAENYRQQLAGAQVDVASANQKADTMQKLLESRSAGDGQAVGLVNNLREQLAGKQSEIDAANARYAEAMARANVGQVLPTPLTNELSQLAAGSPDVIEFDSARGVVKFKSDLTFDLGDATLKPAAKDILNKFATILNAPQASQYELLVAGHTDATPVSNPATIQKGHKNNWYLSSHRAITVGEALVGQKVNPARIGVVGYADQHPVASNGTDAGRGQNRRVEVLILPTQAKAGPSTQPTAEGGMTPPTPVRRAKPDSGKDAAGPQDVK